MPAQHALGQHEVERPVAVEDLLPGKAGSDHRVELAAGVPAGQQGAGVVVGLW